MFDRPPRVCVCVGIRGQDVPNLTYTPLVVLKNAQCMVWHTYWHAMQHTGVQCSTLYALSTAAICVFFALTVLSPCQEIRAPDAPRVTGI